MAKLKITQVKSSIGAKQNMKDTLRTLGLRKIGQSVVRMQKPFAVPSTPFVTWLKLRRSTDHGGLHEEHR